MSTTHTIELALGTEYGCTSSLIDGEVLVANSLSVMSSTCALLIRRGFDENDAAKFVRDGGHVGSFKLSSPSRWPQPRRAAA